MATNDPEGPGVQALGDPCPVCHVPQPEPLPYVEIAGDCFQVCRGCVGRFVDAYAEADAYTTPSGSRLRVVKKA